MANRVPEYVWNVMPEVCPDLLPGPGGWASLGMIYEKGKDLPVGFARREIGYPSVEPNCAFCHTGAYRTSADGPEQIALGAPAHQLDLQAFQWFLYDCAKDSRFTTENVLSKIQDTQDLSWFQTQVYKYAIIPFAKSGLEMQASEYEWQKSRPPQGRGRTDTFNPTKITVFHLPDDGTIGTVDLPAIWNQQAREGMHLHWDGNNDDIHERNYAAAMAIGATPDSVLPANFDKVADFVLRRLRDRSAPCQRPHRRGGRLGDGDRGQQVAKHGPDVLIHLGDIYYAGTPDECQKYFLDIVDKVFDRSSGRVPVYNLCGNHDVYSGGAGFYGLLPKLNPAPPFDAGWAQGASYFALRSPGWQLLGMDTGLHDHDPFNVDDNITYLDPDEETWHVDKVRRFSENGGRTILFSHHQLFSAFSAIGQGATNPKLQESWQKLQAAGNVAAWFWGHEHNLCIYEPFAGLDKGRCMGHGAIPAFLDPDPYAPIANVEPLPALVDDPGKPGKKLQLATSGPVYDHGFIMVELDDAARTAKVSYYQASQPDTPMFEEVL